MVVVDGMIGNRSVINSRARTFFVGAVFVVVTVAPPQITNFFFLFTLFPTTCRFALHFVVVIRLLFFDFSFVFTIIIIVDTTHAIVDVKIHRFYERMKQKY